MNNVNRSSSKKIPWNKGKKGCFSNETLKKISDNMKEKIPWNKGKVGLQKMSPETKNKLSKIRSGHKPTNFLTIEIIRQKYPFFSQIEEIIYNPDKPEEKEIQVHCKNSNCDNSKEKGGWFTPTGTQITERIRQLEKSDGNDGAYFYCSNECKKECPLFNLKSDPYKQNNKPYTEEEYQTFRYFVLDRDMYVCQFCGEEASEVHHEKPQKLEPFFALDPDYSWSCCKLCHYKFGHKDKCSTGVLANKFC